MVQEKILHGADYNPDQWLDRPDILKKDIELMKEACINTATIGMFSWDKIEPEEGRFEFGWLDSIMDTLYENGIKVILATPSAARPAWMSKKYPEVLRTNERGEKMRHGGRHNHCFSSPIYRKKVTIINKKIAERYKNHPALLMWHISNEYGGECHCEYCQENFRSWLKKEYGTLENLNASWWTTFWAHTYTSWDQIESPSPLGEHEVHGMNLDWRRFVTDQTIDFYEHEIKDIRKLTPNIPITTNFMADTMDLIPFQGLDYYKFAKHVDVVSWDCYPAWHNDWETTADLASKVGFIDDLYRSLKQQPFLLMESTPSMVNWHPVNKAKRPGMHMVSSMQHIAHGSDSNLYFQWRKSRGSSEKFHGAVVDHDNNNQNRVFQDVKKVGKSLEKINKVTGSSKKSRVGIIYDWDSNWAINDSQGFSQETKQYPQTLQNHYRFFWNNDIPVDIISPKADLSQYDLIVAPMLYLVDESSLDKFSTYVANGGNLVMSYISGVVNEHDLTYMNGWPQQLQEIFGINSVETDVYYPKDRNRILIDGKSFEVKDYAELFDVKSAHVIGTYDEDFYAGQAAITENNFGKGKGYFIGARTNQEFLDYFYSYICKKLQICNDFVIKGNDNVSVQSRKLSNKEVFFIMNFSESNQKILVSSETVDLLSGKHVNVEINMFPYEVKVLEKRE